jgi:hypothetical protein
MWFGAETSTVKPAAAVIIIITKALRAASQGCSADMMTKTAGLLQGWAGLYWYIRYAWSSVEFALPDYPVDSLEISPSMMRVARYIRRCSMTRGI